VVLGVAVQEKDPAEIPVQARVIEALVVVIAFGIRRSPWPSSSAAAWCSSARASRSWW
jgi:hypothetical protein